MENCSQENIDSFQDEYRFLSNFWPSPVDYMGDLYPTVEHAFQAMKTKDHEERALVLKASTPGKAKRLGREVTLREDWEDLKLEVMEHFLRLKFDTYPLHEQLMDTGTRELIEGNTWGDKFWGTVDGVGENHLGKLLMKIRKEKLNEKLLLSCII